MENSKHYPTHPGAEHPPIMTCEIPLEEYESLKLENAELKAKLESVQATAYAESVDAGMENRRLKRALWLARADRAKTEYNHWILIWHCELNNHLFFINKTRYKNRAKVDRLHYPWEWRDIWDEVERKCRAKAEQYL
jgi:hypothetical protein